MLPAPRALDVGAPRLVAEDVEVRRAAVHEPQRHAGVDRMDDRALSFDPQELAAPLVALDDEPLGGAGEEVGHDGVDRDSPARDRDPGLARRDEDGADAAPPRLEVELAADRHLPDRAVRADG